MENLCEAWQEFIRGKRNKEDVQEFVFHLGDALSDLHDDLMNGKYQHGSYRHFRINDPKPRDIHKASVRDRLLHHAIHRKLYPFFARLFISDSFSCQIDKGLHRALTRFEQLARKVSRNNTRTCWILKCDIRKFFASVDHIILIDILHCRIADKRLIDLLENIIASFAASFGKGIPLGNLTSQLFANIYMSEFDQFIKHDLRTKYYIRYADDFVLLSHDRNELIHCLPKVAAFLFGQLNLNLHPDKVSTRTLASGVDYLGWIHFSYHHVLRTKVKKRMLNSVRRNPTNEALQSYLGLIQHGDAYTLSNRLLNDYWLWKED